MYQHNETSNNWNQMLKQCTEVTHKANKLTGDKKLVKTLLLSLCNVYFNSIYSEANPYVTDFDSHRMYDELMGILDKKFGNGSIPACFVKTLQECQLRSEKKEYVSISQYEIYIDTVVRLYNWMVTQGQTHVVPRSVCIEILASPNGAAILIGEIRSLKKNHSSYMIAKRIMLLDNNCKIATLVSFSDLDVGIINNHYYGDKYVMCDGESTREITWIPETTKVRVL